MHKRMKHILILIMAVVLMTSSLFVLVSHILCERCSDSHSAQLTEKTYTKKCCTSYQKGSLDNCGHETKDSNEDEKSSTCPCCNSVFEDLLSENDIHKQNFLSSQDLDFTLLYVFIKEIFNIKSSAKTYIFTPVKIPVSGREILAFNSVLII